MSHADQTLTDFAARWRDTHAPTFDDSEMAYCIALSGSHGNAEVGRTSRAVASYLDCQAVRAWQHGDAESCARLAIASKRVGWNDWRGATMALTLAIGT